MGSLPQRWRQVWRERRSVRWTIQVLLVFALYLALSAWQTLGTATGQAPPLAAVDLSGQAVTLAADGSEPTLVHFWASWCGVCRAEEGNIASVARSRRVITVATQSGGPDEVRAYLREHRLDLRTVVDSDGALASAWGVRSLPTTFVIDAEGRIDHVVVGYTTTLGLMARAFLAGL